MTIRQGSSNAGIILRINTKSSASEESYQLQMNADSVVISAQNGKGIFYGLISLLQIIRQSPKQNNGINLSCWNNQ